jgi:hypothetical protein
MRPTPRPVIEFAHPNGPPVSRADDAGCFARRALEFLFPGAAKGSPFFDIAKHARHVASQCAILANRGILVVRLTKPLRFGGKPANFRVQRTAFRRG